MKQREFKSHRYRMYPNVESTLVQENGWKSMNKDSVNDDKQLLKQIADGDRHALAEHTRPEERFG